MTKVMVTERLTLRRLELHDAAARGDSHSFAVTLTEGRDFPGVIGYM
ncbi:hypothetical protein [Paenibacillus donghaensis]|nr:hypothetical protein [Paenibacillus donghaensis]